MALQDLTPQLRTRLSRLERVVGIFILFAGVFMVAGLSFYLYNTAVRRGWFLTKAPYFTYLRSGGGIREGDPVKLMGFDVGQITKITAEQPGSFYDVYVEFVILDPYYGYIWSDSKVNIKSAGLLGNRYLEVVKGDASGAHGKVYETFRHRDTKLLMTTRREIDQILTDKSGVYTNWLAYGQRPYFIEASEPPELSAQMDSIVQQAKDALPHVLALTNLLTRVMANTATATDRINKILDQVDPVIGNISVITSNLKEPKGALGDWLIPTNINPPLVQTLTNANAAILSAQQTLTNANAQLTEIATSLDQVFENLSMITGNLNQQVASNTNILSSVSSLIINTDNLIQGMKRHWLLRSAFRTNAPPQQPRNSNRSATGPDRYMDRRK